MHLHKDIVAVTAAPLTQKARMYCGREIDVNSPCRKSSTTLYPSLASCKDCITSYAKKIYPCGCFVDKKNVLIIACQVHKKILESLRYETEKEEVDVCLKDISLDGEGLE